MVVCCPFEHLHYSIYSNLLQVGIIAKYIAAISYDLYTFFTVWPMPVFRCMATATSNLDFCFSVHTVFGAELDFRFPRRYISVVARFQHRLEFLFFGAISDSSNPNYYFRFQFLFLFLCLFRFRLRPSACSVFRSHPFPWAAQRRFLVGGLTDYSRAYALDLARSRSSDGVGSSFDYLLIYARFSHDLRTIYARLNIIFIIFADFEQKAGEFYQITGKSRRGVSSHPPEKF